MSKPEEASEAAAPVVEPVITVEAKEGSPDVYRRIAAVSGELAKDGIKKNRRNQAQGFSFRGIDDVYNALSSVMAANGLVVLPRMMERHVTERETKSGSVLFSVVVDAEFDFVAASDGSKHTVRTFGEAMDSGDKATNKAMSAAYKYAAFQAFCIPTEGDGHDADEHTPEPIAPKKPYQAPVDHQPQREPGDETDFDSAEMAGETAPKKTYGKSTSTKPITEKQRGRLFAIVKKSNRQNAIVKVWLKSKYGLESSNDIPMNLYEEICTAIEAPGPLPID